MTAMKLPFDWKALSGPVSKTAGSTQLIVVVNAALVLVLAYHAAALSWRLAPAVDGEPAPAALVSSSPQAVKANGGWNIARWSLFGQESRDAAPTMEQKTIPKTRLNLTLHGVFVADNGGGAIIATAKGKEQYYTVNAKLPGGAILKEIHPQHVVLMRNRQLETLELPKNSIAIGPSSSSSSSRRSALRSFTGSQVNLKQYRRDLMREPQRLADAISMSPYSERGRFIGYKVTPGRDRALFDQVGLISGDIVTAVNGIELDTPAKGLNVLRSLQTANSVRLDIKRNGRAQSFDVNIN